jgi:hypothetical protein
MTFCAVVVPTNIIAELINITFTQYYMPSTFIYYS